MKFLIITHVAHIASDNHYFAYSPYVREMNVWLRHVDEVIIVAPLESNYEPTAIDLKYEHQKIHFQSVATFDIKSVVSVLKTVFLLPKIVVTLFRAMQQADHIHLRCPGNMGLLGALVQIVFPKKKKTAKYAGNWDPKAKQPFTYKLQRWIISNTFLTQNMQVLVYGEWENQTKNIKPFFTATYTEAEKHQFSTLQKPYKSTKSFDSAQLDNDDKLMSLRAKSRTTENSFDSSSLENIDELMSLRAKSRTTENSFDSTQLEKDDDSLLLRAKSRTTENSFISSSLEKDDDSLSLRAKSRTNKIEKGSYRLSETQISFLFVGTLSIGKQPLYAIQLVEKLYKNGKKVTLELYGEGVLRKELEVYILQNSLEKIVTLKGNQSKESLITAYQNSHFLLLPSKSEGWPKAVAEAMFWGCVPLATAVSCVPYMLDFEKRGKFLKLQLDADVQAIENVIANVDAYISLSENSKNWSQAFTLEVFETEIKKLLNCV